MQHWIAAVITIFLAGVVLDEVGFFDRGEVYHAQAD